MSSTPLHHARLIFIGGGNMARSLIGGLLQRGHQATAIHVVEPNAPLREALQNDFGVTCHTDNSSIHDDADCVLLVVKPQVMRTVCEGLRDKIGKAMLLSVAAGITTKQISEWSGTATVIRCMPNTPALIGAGASGLFADASVSDEQRALASHLLEAVGIARWIDDEARMDIVTALSGSGPAYVFYLVEAMSTAASQLGLDADTARDLAIQTCLGAARMLSESDEPADALRRRVTSPGGTTQAAIESLQANHFAQIIADAISSATERGKALAAAAGG
jgi:pyrroline-5-carboxylate reductase